MNRRFILNRKKGIHASISRRNILKLQLLALEYGSNASKVIESLLASAPEPAFWLEYQAALERMIGAGQNPDLAIAEIIEAAKVGRKIREIDW